MASDWSYVDKVILAPMVRIGTLPMRVLAARCGADIVYSEEVIDKKIMSCTRTVNAERGTVDFATKSGEMAFQTLVDCVECVVFQVGTADAVCALKAAQIVAADIRAVRAHLSSRVKFSRLQTCVTHTCTLLLAFQSARISTH